LLIGLFFYLGIGRDLMKRRIVLQGKEAKINFPRSQRGIRKGKKVLASHFEAYQGFGVDVYLEI